MAENFKVYNRFVTPCIQLEHEKDGGRVYLKDITNFQVKHQGQTEWMSVDIQKMHSLGQMWIFDYDSIYKNLWFVLPRSWDESKSLGGKIKFNYKGSPAVSNGSPEISVDLAWNPRPSFNTVKSPSTVQISTTGDVEIQLTSDGSPLDRLNTGAVFYPEYVTFEAVQNERTIKLKSKLCDDDKWIWGYHHRGKYVVTIPESLTPGEYKLYACIGTSYSDTSQVKNEIPINDTRPKIQPASYYRNIYKLESTLLAGGLEFNLRFHNFSFDMIALDKNNTTKYIALCSGFDTNDLSASFGAATSHWQSIFLLTKDYYTYNKTTQNLGLNAQKIKTKIASAYPTNNVSRSDYIKDFKFMVVVTIPIINKSLTLLSPLPEDFLGAIINPPPSSDTGSGSGGGSGSGTGTGGDTGGGGGTGSESGTGTGSGKPPTDDVIYLEKDAKYHLHSTTKKTIVYGNTGSERLILCAKATNVTVSSTVEIVDLPGSCLDYTFSSTSSGLNAYRDSTLVLSVVCGQSGNELRFSEGSLTVKVVADTGAVILGGQSLTTSKAAYSGSSYNTNHKSESCDSDSGTGGGTNDNKTDTGTGGGTPPKVNNPETDYVPPKEDEIGVNIGGGSSSGQRAIVLKQKGGSKIIVDFINFKWDDIDDISL